VAAMFHDHGRLFFEQEQQDRVSTVRLFCAPAFRNSSSFHKSTYYYSDKTATYVHYYLFTTE
jgi:hypothetical protein